MSRLNKTEIVLHWIVGLGMIGMIAMGIYMDKAEVRSLMPIHKSTGAVLLIVILVRVIQRMRAGWPENVSKGKAWEHAIARVTHWVLIVGTLVMPISGIIDSLMGGRGLTVFGMEFIGANLGEDGRAEAISKSMSDLAGTVHGLAVNILIAAILLHVAGALKHHFIDRDETLKRMVNRA